MLIKDVNFDVSPRIIRIAAAVVLSVIIVELYGATGIEGISGV